MTKEQRFYQKFVSHLPVAAHCCRIENAMESGMPDTSICDNGIEVWCELKCYEGGRVLIRPYQNSWGVRRSHAGGRVFVLAYHECGEIHVWRFPNIEFIPHGKYLQITNKPLATRHWEDLLNILFT